MKKIFGWLLIGSPLLFMFVIGVIKNGWGQTIISWVIAIILVSMFISGAFLLSKNPTKGS